MTKPIAGQPPLAGVPGKEVTVRAPAAVAGTADGAMAPADLPAVKIKSPADVVSLVSWILGFRPGARDLVVIGTAPPRGGSSSPSATTCPASLISCSRP